MVPTIGIMVGFYIITKMLHLASEKSESPVDGVIKLFAVITIIVTILCVFSLFGQSLG